MANKDKQKDDQRLKDVYGNGYREPLPCDGPDASRNNSNPLKRPGTNVNESTGKPKEEEETRDPNAIPTDFTSRQAKVWDAKAKALERNWKRRKVEELRCHICGEWGHFPQGCPSTLGINRKRDNIVEIIHLNDKDFKSKLVGTGGSVIKGIETDTGCCLQVEDDPKVGSESFSVHISGPNRFLVSKALNLVRDLLDKGRGDWSQQGGRRSHIPYRELSSVPLAAQMKHITVEKGGFYHPRASHPDGGQNFSDLEARQQWEAASFQEPNARAALGFSNVIPDREDPLYYGWNQREYHPNHQAKFVAGNKQQLSHGNFEGLDQKCLDDESMELSKQQAAEEEREMDRHREQMRLIHEHFQQKKVELRAKHTEQLKRFLERQGHPLLQQYPLQNTSDRSASREGSQFPGINHGSIAYEQQYDLNTPKHKQTHEAGFGSFHESRQQYQNPSYPYSRRQEYEMKTSRDVQGYDYDAYTRRSPAQRPYR